MILGMMRLMPLLNRASTISNMTSLEYGFSKANILGLPGCFSRPDLRLPGIISFEVTPCLQK
jgi:hypothetical protein